MAFRANSLSCSFTGCTWPSGCAHSELPTKYQCFCLMNVHTLCTMLQTSGPLRTRSPTHKHTHTRTQYTHVHKHPTYVHTCTHKHTCIHATPTYTCKHPIHVYTIRAHTATHTHIHMSAHTHSLCFPRYWLRQLCCYKYQGRRQTALREEGQPPRKQESVQ